MDDVMAQAAVENVVDYGGFHIQFISAASAMEAVRVKNKLEEAGFSLFSFNSNEALTTSGAWLKSDNGFLYLLTAAQPEYDDSTMTGARFPEPIAVPTVDDHAVRLDLYHWETFRPGDGIPGGPPDVWEFSGAPPEAFNEENTPVRTLIFLNVDDAIAMVNELKIMDV